MTNRLAYHVVVHALEARAGWTPAHNVGFADLSHMTRAFGSACGLALEPV